MRFHLLGLSHTKTNCEYEFCAFTQKVRKLALMLTAKGHDVIHYGAEGADVPCEDVCVLSDADQRDSYSQWDFTKEQFKFWSDAPALKLFDAKTVVEIRKRKRPGDVLLATFGLAHQNIARAVDIPLTVESGIGYSGVFAPFKVFESYAWMHYLYGKNQSNGVWYDCVIPNAFDESQFSAGLGGNYFCMFARLNRDKGVQTALDTCRIVKARLVIAGQGSLEGYDTKGVEVEHVGVVGAARRNAIMGGARALFLPTEYIEPFGGAAVEAQMCGTPAITTDWGAFPETVVHGVTGYRCRCLSDFVYAAVHAGGLSRAAVRKWAVENFSMGRIADMYEEYFQKLSALSGKGWYEAGRRGGRLAWLERAYPGGKAVGNGY